MENKIYDTIIIGAGAAGLSAAVYASRAMLDFVVLEGGAAGGQMLTTSEIDNYPGFINTDGAELSTAMREHAEKLGARINRERILSIEKSNDIWKVCGEDKDYLSKTVIIATGAKHRPLGVPGEADFVGRGVSYCAVCDGMFFRGKTVAVVGGGNSAAEEALHLSGLCEKVYLIHRRDKLRANAALSSRVLAAENIIPVWNSEIEAVEGEMRVKSIKLKDGNEIAVDGVFVSIGVLPISDIFTQIVDMDEMGFIIADESCETTASGIFVAGDVRTKRLRQIVTAVADGANATAAVERYISA